MTTQRIATVLLYLGLLTGVVLTQSPAPKKKYPSIYPGQRRPPNTNVPGANQPVEATLPTKRFINPPQKPGQAPFCDAVQVDNTLYLSGRLGIDPRTGQVPADVSTEIRIILEGMRGTLAEAGMTMDDLVTVQVFMTDLSQYDQFNAVYRTYFTRAVPARAIMGVQKLLRGARFEIQGMAVRTE
jgi:2-iminobutanoate/2-iminopropanoate deaminase